MSVKVILSSIGKIADRQYFVEWHYSDATAKKKWGSEHLTAAKCEKTSDATEEFKVVWEYRAKKKGSSSQEWFLGTEETVSKLVWKSQYSPPDYANRIRVKVKPISKTYTYKSNTKSKTAHYFTSEYSSWKEKKTDDLTNDPEEPSGVQTPEVKMTESNGITISLLVTGIEPDDNTDDVQFRLIADNKTVEEKKVDKTISTQTASVTFKNVDPGHVYKIGVRAHNKTTDEYSDIVYTGEIKVMPPNVQIEEIKNHSETEIYIKLSKTNGFAEYYEVRGSNEPNAFNNNDASAIQTWQLEGGKRYGVIPIDAIGKKWHFQGRAVNSAGASKWSDTVWYSGLSKKPNPPTIWSGSASGKVGDIIRLYWTHNPTDGSAQEAAKVTITNMNDLATAKFEYKIGSDWTPVTLTAGSSITIGVENTKDDYGEWKIDTLNIPIKGTAGCNLGWSVKTKGLNASYSDASLTRQLDFYDTPTVSLAIEPVVDRYPIDIKIVSSDLHSKILSYHASIVAREDYETSSMPPYQRRISKGDPIWNGYGDGINMSTYSKDITLQAGDAALENGVKYMLEVVTSYDSGISVTTTRNFEVSWTDEYDIPEPELFAVAYNPNDLSYRFKPACVTWPDDENYEYVPGVELSVYRLQSDGSYICLGENLTNSNKTSIVDPHPAINYQTYRVVATSVVTGECTYNDITIDMLPDPCIVIQWSDTPYQYDIFEDDDGNEVSSEDGYILKLPFNITLDESGAPEVSLVNYIGRKNPVSYYGTQQGQSRTIRTEIPKEDVRSNRYDYDRNDVIGKIRRLMAYTGNVYIREPSGLGCWANVNVSMNTNYNSMTIPVAFTITPVEGGI